MRMRWGECCFHIHTRPLSTYVRYSLLIPATYSIHCLRKLSIDMLLMHPRRLRQEGGSELRQSRRGRREEASKREEASCVKAASGRKRAQEGGSKLRKRAQEGGSKRAQEGGSELKREEASCQEGGSELSQSSELRQT